MIDTPGFDAFEQLVDVSKTTCGVMAFAKCQSCAALVALTMEAQNKHVAWHKELMSAVGVKEVQTSTGGNPIKRPDQEAEILPQIGGPVRKKRSRPR